jgi:hypothetical protein
MGSDQGSQNTMEPYRSEALRILISDTRILSPIKNLIFENLKIVTNEKREGSRNWQVFEGCTGPWRSMSVYFFIKPTSSLPRISVSCL